MQNLTQQIIIYLEKFSCVDWIGLAQDRDEWTALVDEVMNLQVP
jgi:hypothetical protein